MKGTHFRARADGDAATLEVLDGEVLATELGASHRGVAVLAGQGAPLKPGAEAVSRKLLPAPQQLLAPERNVVTAQPVEGAASYQLQLSQDPGFLRLVRESHAESPRFALDGSLAPGFYHTRLTAFDAQQIEGLTGGGIVFAARGPGPAESTATRLADGSFEIRWTVRRHGRQTFELARSPTLRRRCSANPAPMPAG